MGERPTLVDVTEGPDTVDIRAQVIISRNVAALIRLDTDRLKSDAVGVGQAASRDENVRTFNAIAISEFDNPARAGSLDLDDRAVAENSNALCVKEIAYGFRNIIVLAGGDIWARFDDRYVGTQTAEDLSHFKADVAASEHYQMTG